MFRLSRMQLTNNQHVFLELVREGLFHVNGSRFMVHGSVVWGEVYRFAEEQSVVGLVTAGLEQVDGSCKPSQVERLQFVGRTLLIEQRNKDLNTFVAELIGILRCANVYGLLVKGQGVAQCYEKPLWRTAGDVDLLLDEKNYQKAKKVLTPIADEIASEDEAKKHQAMVIRGFDVELHGRMPFSLSKKANQVVEEVVDDSLEKNGVCAWTINETEVYLPNPDNHIFLVFTHFLHHFFIEGVGLRQICDWCRMLWKYHSEIDVVLLERRLRSAGLMSEWRAFASLAVDALGMPVEAMPFFDVRFKDKGEKVLKRVLKSGNFGHNNDLSYRTKYSGITYKVVAIWRRILDFVSLIPIFPMDAPRFFVRYVMGKV